MIKKFKLQSLINVSLLALLGACASSGGGSSGGEEAAMSSGTDELESLAASIDSGKGGSASSGTDNDMQINENDLMAGDLKSAPKSGGDELSLDDSSSGGAAPAGGDLSLDDTLAATDTGSSGSSNGGLAITASGSSNMTLSDLPWLQEVTSSSVGFSCKWKTLKNNGKVRHRICSVEKQVVVNVLEKNRGSGLQMAKILFDAKGKAAFNRWKNSMKTAAYRGGKEKTKRNGNTFSRWMSPDHKSFADLIWNGNANAATLVFTPTAKGLGREMRKVAGH